MKPSCRGFHNEIRISHCVKAVKQYNLQSLTFIVGGRGYSLVAFLSAQLLPLSDPSRFFSDLLCTMRSFSIHTPRHTRQTLKPRTVQQGVRRGAGKGHRSVAPTTTFLSTFASCRFYCKGVGCICFCGLHHGEVSGVNVRPVSAPCSADVADAEAATILPANAMHSALYLTLLWKVHILLLSALLLSCCVQLDFKCME